MRIIKRTLAFVIACTMMLCYCFSAVAVEEEQIKTEFELVKVSETTNEVVLSINLVKGSFIAFDIQVEAGDNLECSEIMKSDDLKAWDTESEITSQTNTDNGKISLICPKLCEFESAMTLFTYKYTKLVKDGVTASDFTLSVYSCYSKHDDVDTEITEFTLFNNAVPAEHTHVAGGEFVTTESSTCTKQGTHVKYCTECGDIALSELLPLAEHTKATRTENPTCTEKGATITYCSVCLTELDRKDISAKGHTLVPSHKDATCEEDGYDKQICSVCEQEITSTVLKATGHKEKTITIDPDCENGGYNITLCIVCEKELHREPIAPTGHTTATKTIDPKCEEEGYTITYCTVCEKELDREPIAPTGHHNGRTETIDPTCTEDGCINIYCKDCEKIVNTSKLPATGHKFVQIIKNATCEEDGSIVVECRVCSYREIDNVISKAGHSWSGWKTIRNATYSEEGLKERTCSVCHKTEQKAIPVIYVKPTDIIILPENDITLKLGKSTQLYGNFLPSEASYSNTITWTSSNERALTVDENGVVTAVGFGSATITASTADGKVKTTKNIKVKFSLWQWLVKVILGWITGNK